MEEKLYSQEQINENDASNFKRSNNNIYSKDSNEFEFKESNEFEFKESNVSEVSEKDNEFKEWNESNIFNECKFKEYKVKERERKNFSPRDFSSKKKYSILFIITAAEVLAPLVNIIFYPALSDMRIDLNTSEYLINVFVAIYVVFWGIAPFFWATYSDTFGTRRKMYLLCLPMVIIASIISAIVKNIWILIVMRAFQAIGTSCLLSIGAAVISDLFLPLERGNANGIFFIGYDMGDILSPIIGGFINQYLNWKYINWFIVFYAVIILSLVIPFIPETFSNLSSELSISPESSPDSSSISKQEKDQEQEEKKQNQQEQQQELNNKKYFNPLDPIKLLRYPNVSLIISHTSILAIVLFAQSLVIPKGFPKIYKISSSLMGLSFLPLGIGRLLGSYIGGKYSDYVMSKGKSEDEEEKDNDNNNDNNNNNKVKLINYERRINSIWIGAILVALTNFALGWIIQAKVHISIPLIVLALGGFGVTFAFPALLTYLIDSYPTKNASIISVNDGMSFFSSGIMTIIIPHLEDCLGYGYTFTLLGFLSLVGLGSSVIVYFKGKLWRERGVN
ncbi:hypothetical protein Glove_166g156 [Diversispora epigaea]|uniref:Major facilitator superfamily (MFS) profile domain-containing protein n=1 Tax=Diversispora epigaea TaxID=1348612 RepID=A0A397IV42_9GLOM|nr:hypothetical protein Glove_166g156 [Diversispora epigaea]